MGTAIPDPPVLVAPMYAGGRLEAAFATYKTTTLQPKVPGKCFFHSQNPDKQDEVVFTRLGGTIGACTQVCPIIPAQTCPTMDSYIKWTDAKICDCTPGDASAFGRTFLEIGANDGQFLSNSLFFESQMGWRGLCVEASPFNFNNLHKNRPLCANVQALVGNREGTGTFASFEHESSTKGWEDLMSCLVGSPGSSICRTKESAEAYAKRGSFPMKFYEVPWLKLSDLFAEQCFEEMGWWSIDTEGAEEYVIETIDMSKASANFVIVEGTGMTPKITSMLSNAGYKEEGKKNLDHWFTKGDSTF